MNSHAFDQFNDKFVIENSWRWQTTPLLMCAKCCLFLYVARVSFVDTFGEYRPTNLDTIQILTSHQNLKMCVQFGELSAPVVLSSSALQGGDNSSSIAFGSASQRSTREEDQDTLL